MKSTAIGVLLILFSAAQVGAQTPSPSPTVLAQITDRGRSLEAYDQAAWHGSDAAVALAGHDTAGLDLFIARKVGGAWLVDFGKLDAPGTAFLTKIEARSDDGRHFTAQRFSSGRPDVGFLVAAAHAVKTSEAAFQAVANRRYNVAVLPNDDGSLYVYLYPAQTVKGIFPLGGDERFRVSADGMTIVDAHRMHRSIIDAAVPPPTQDKRLVAGFHTDIFSDVPEDTDVFHVLARTPLIPEYVVARGNRYLIQTDGSIEPNGSVVH